MIKEKQCSSEKDFIAMFLENNRVWRPLKFDTKEEMALSVWNELVLKEEHFYKKYGYLNVIYDEKTNIYSRKKVRGRPQTNKAKEHRLTVRMNDKQKKDLDDYCRTNNINDKSEVIREAIVEYLKSKTD